MSEEVFPPGQPTVDSAGPWLPALDTKTITIIILALSLGGPMDNYYNCFILLTFLYFFTFYFLLYLIFLLFFTFYFFVLLYFCSWCYMIWKCTQTV